MSALKKAASCILTPECYSRRSSLTLLDKGLTDHPLSDLSIKLKFGSASRGSLTSLVPQIFFDGEVSSNSLNRSEYLQDSPFRNSDRRNSLQTPCSLNPQTPSFQGRRASCGPCMQVWRSSSPEIKGFPNDDEPDGYGRSSWSSRSSYANALQRNSPAGDKKYERGYEDFLKVPRIGFKRHSFAQVTAKRNSCEISASPLSESPSPQQGSPKSCSSASSTHSWLRIPSLSPCFEDQPKRAFQFEGALTPNKESAKGRDSLDPVHGRYKRRFSFNPTQLSAQLHFPHAGVFWCQNSPFSREKQRDETPEIRSAPHRFSSRESTPRDLNNNLSCVDRLQNPATSPCVGQNLGKGGFGTVRVGFWKGKKVAIKVIKGKKMSSVKHEMNLLGVAPHPRLVNTFEVYIKESNGQVFSCSLAHSRTKESVRRVTFPSILNLKGLRQSQNEANPAFSFIYESTPESKSAFVISELCSSVNLLKLINFPGQKWALRDKIRILEQISSGLDYLHSLNLVHLDVKPSNCFFTLSGKAKLGDFGCCSKIGQIPNQILGTVVYQAPEVLRGDVLGEKSDIYSLAITAWHLLTQEFPYPGLHPHVVIYKVTRMGCRPDTNTKMNWSDGREQENTTLLEFLLKKIIHQCWAQEPSRRPSAAMVRRILMALYLSPARD